MRVLAVKMTRPRSRLAKGLARDCAEDVVAGPRETSLRKNSTRLCCYGAAIYPANWNPLCEFSTSALCWDRFAFSRLVGL